MNAIFFRPSQRVTFSFADHASRTSKRPGTFARFIVDLLQAALDALGFFERTQHRYTRYNYIGEWHSHPSFAVHPSSIDVRSMRTIVEDPKFHGNFAVLMIVRLDDGERDFQVRG